MMCTNPVNLPHRGKVPCGKCLACLQRKQKDWAFRIMQEVRSSDSAWFVTLTYDDAFLPMSVAGENGESFSFPIVSKRDVQLWLKRLRKSIEPCKIRYFIASEYGPKTFRPHYHAIIFGLPFKNNVVYESIVQTWKNGFVQVAPVTLGRAYYVAKYSCSFSLLPAYLQRREYRPFFLSSRRGGIGIGFLTESVVESLRQSPQSYVVLAGGVKQSMPRYYRDKLYDDDMKAELSDSAYISNIDKRLKLIKEDEKLYKTRGLSGLLASEAEKVDTFNRRILNRIKQKSKL